MLLKDGICLGFSVFARRVHAWCGALMKYSFLMGKITVHRIHRIYTENQQKT